MMIAPIYDAGNAFSGMVAATIDADLLNTLLRDRSLSSGGDIHVVDEDGRVMLDDTVEEIFDDLSADPYFAVLEETPRGFLIGNSEHLNTEALFAFAPVTSGREEWSVVLSIPTTELDASSNDLAARSILIALTSAIIAGIIAYVTTGGIVQPLRQLTSAAQLISQGHYDAPVPANTRERGDEVGQLARALHDMEAAIDKRNTDLQQLNASLEQRVEQRTEELRGANRELQAAFARVKEAARVKSEFLANVSHELRTPLNAIIGFSDMLLAGMSGALNEKQQHKVSRLRENGGRLLTLINDLLDITRIEAGRMDVLHKPFAVHTMFERLTQQLEVLAHQKNLEFMVQVDPELPETVLGDEKRLEQIITNLVSNAVKFTPEGSVRVNVQVNNTAREWQIVVADTGVGIPPHALNLIFEEFRQIDGSYARAYKGSGLGLAITRNLVRLMEGKINVSSQIDQGSTFTVTLPLDTPDVDEGEPTTEEAQYA
jgi:signal transduction histidine kinase